MYIYYVLRGSQGGEPQEVEGDITEEAFPGIELDDGPAIIHALVEKMRDEGIRSEWEQCDLTDDFFEREETYIYFHGRWMRRADAPWRKDRNN